MGVDSEHAAYGLAQEDRSGQAYDEAAFRHFLSIERARAHAAQRAFLLLLVTVKKDQHLGTRIPPALASLLFAALGDCVREVDFIGWYRQGRVAAAVLTQGVDGPGSEAPARIAERVRGALSRGLPASAARRLQVRVLQLHRRPSC